MNMTDNPQNEAAIEANNKVLSRFANLDLIANSIERGSPEHADYIARSLNLPSPPPPPLELQLAEQRKLASMPPLERHQRKCAICHHPDREEIEELFLHWHQPYSTAHHYKVPPRSLYRHAHATGLYLIRQQNLRSVLDRFLERVHDATVSGDSIIRAIRAYSCLTPNNKWVEPPTRVIYSTEPRRPDQEPVVSLPNHRRPERGCTGAEWKGTSSNRRRPKKSARKSRRTNQHGDD
jgi:hypothetical protein